MTNRSILRNTAMQLMAIAFVLAAPAIYAADIKVHVDDTTVARSQSAGGAAAFIARLDQQVPKGAVLTLDWETVDGTAVGKVDFIPAKGSVKVTPEDKKLKVLAVVVLLSGKDAPAKNAFSIKLTASITGSNAVILDNPAGKATATIYKDTTTRVAPRAN